MPRELLTSQEETGHLPPFYLVSKPVPSPPQKCPQSHEQLETLQGRIKVPVLYVLPSLNWVGKISPERSNSITFLLERSQGFSVWPFTMNSSREPGMEARLLI